VRFKADLAKQTSQCKNLAYYTLFIHNDTVHHCGEDGLIIKRRMKHTGTS